MYRLPKTQEPGISAPWKCLGWKHGPLSVVAYLPSLFFARHRAVLPRARQAEGRISCRRATLRRSRGQWIRPSRLLSTPVQQFDSTHGVLVPFLVLLVHRTWGAAEKYPHHFTDLIAHRAAYRAACIVRPPSGSNTHSCFAAHCRLPGSCFYCSQCLPRPPWPNIGAQIWMKMAFPTVL